MRSPKDGRKQRRGQKTVRKPSDESVRNESLHSRLLNYIGEIVYSVKIAKDLLAGQVEFVSPEVEQILGYRPEEFIKNSALWLQSIHPDDVASIGQLTVDMIRTGSSATRLYRLRHKRTGTYRWMEDKVVPQLDAKRHVVRLIGAARDVTERRQAESLLRFQADILRNVQDSVIVTDLDGKITYWNEGATHIFGYTGQEMLGKSAAILYPDQDPTKLAEDLKIVLEGRDYVGEWKGRRKDGSTVWVNIKTTVTKDEKNAVTGFISVAKDFTERKRREEELRKLFNAIEQVEDCVFITDRNGVIEYVNPAFEQVSGYTKEEAIGKTPRILKSGKHDNATYEKMWNDLLSGQTVRFEFINKKKNGELYNDDRCITPLKDSHGNITHFVSTGRDVTQRRRLEKEVTEISANERQRIGQDLHDSLGQQLTGIALLAKSLERKLEEESNPASVLAAEIAKVLNQSITRIREVSECLFPHLIESSGINAALKALAANTEELFGVSCKFASDASADIREIFTATQVYRIAQEAITNAIKHGEATRITIELHRQNDRITLKVRDDGVRKLDDIEAKSGLGMRIMRYRARMIDATFHATPHEGGGVEVVCSFQPPGEKP